MKSNLKCGITGHPGFALPVAIGMFLTASIMFGGVLSYVTFSTRYVKGELKKGGCLAAAQSAIEVFKGEVELANRNWEYKYGDLVGGSGYSAKDSFDKWANPVVSNSSTIKIGSGDACVECPSVIKDSRNNCTVVLSVEKLSPGELTIFATGTDGHGVAVTIMEVFDFSNARPTSVFNYAYFVNNYGWMNGTSIVINGDFRANGDVSITGSVVNGIVYSAPNTEVGAQGEVSFAPVRQQVGSGWNASYTYTYPSVLSRDQFWSHEETSPARPTSPPSAAADAPVWNGGFVAPSSGVTLTPNSVTDPNDSGHAFLSEARTGIAMPYISDLKDYRAHAQELNAKTTEGGAALATLKYCPYNPETGTVDVGNKQTISVSNYTVDDDTNTKWNNEMLPSATLGPSGVAGAGDQGAVVLVGTEDNPIEINGPVVIASDVVIMGYITGQGSIYCGRNVHIVGDLTYKNPPSWPHPDTTPEATARANHNKDLVTLLAKGCVVVGNHTSAEWKSGIEPYITPGSGSEDITRRYYCDQNDTSIGYPDPGSNKNGTKFNGNYAAEIVSTVSSSTVEKYYDSAYTYPITITKTYDKKGRETKTTSKVGDPVLKKIDTPYSAKSRNINSEFVSEKTTKESQTWNGKTVTETVYAVIGNSNDPNYSTIRNKNPGNAYKNKGVRYYDSVVGDDVINKLATTGNQYVYGNNRAEGVSQIDSVIYDNHGTFGFVGQAGRGFTINGSLVCRDEALVGHNLNSGDRMVFNWDIRLKSDGAEGIDRNNWSPPTESCTDLKHWQIVPSALNKVYNSIGAAGGGA
ncbi:MAG: hypothetical protein K6G91_05335 [Kiritimatiellae bacterium]|nr:hypothetical protein [Kiritimatiellia bacterium]